MLLEFDFIIIGSTLDFYPDAHIDDSFFVTKSIQWIFIKRNFVTISIYVDLARNYYLHIITLQ